MAPGLRPLQYGNLFVETALGDRDAKIVPIVNSTSITGCAISRASALHVASKHISRQYGRLNLMCSGWLRRVCGADRRVGWADH